MNLSMRIKEETMEKVASVSEAELEVMEMLWDQDGAVKQSYLLALFEEDGKHWKRQTLNTFLLRLEDKGLIKRENRLVEPLYGRDEYANIQVKAVLDRIYRGKLSNSMTAYVKENVEVNNLADFIVELVFFGKETVLEALQNDDRKVLADALYYAIQDCEPESSK